MTTQPPTLGPDLTVKGLNVYAGPGNSYDRVKIGGRAVFIEGGSHAILGKDADTAIWYQIRINNTTGWIRAAYVQTYGNLDSLAVDQTLPRLSRAASGLTWMKCKV